MLRQHADALTRQHWEEIALNRAVALDVDWEFYEAKEAEGSLFVVAAFVDDTIVGYSVNATFWHPHYRTTPMCQNDALYLHPEWRNGAGGRIGRDLMRETVDEARRRGCKRMLWHAKKGTALDVLLSRSSDYIVQDILYSKEL